MENAEKMNKTCKTAPDKNAKMQNKRKKKHRPGAEHRQKVHFHNTKCNEDVWKHEGWLSAAPQKGGRQSQILIADTIGHICQCQFEFYWHSLRLKTHLCWAQLRIPQFFQDGRLLCASDIHVVMSG